MSNIINIGTKSKRARIDPAIKARVMERMAAGESASDAAKSESVSYGAVMYWKKQNSGATKPAKKAKAATTETGAMSLEAENEALRK